MPNSQYQLLFVQLFYLDDLAYFDEKTFQRIFQTHLKDSSSDPSEVQQATGNIPGKEEEELKKKMQLVN